MTELLGFVPQHQPTKTCHSSVVSTISIWFRFIPIGNLKKENT